MNSKALRIVYMGTPDFAVEPLRLLVEGGYNVVGVVTVPDKPAGRGLKVQQSAVKTYAVANNLPVFQPDKLRDPQWVDTFRALEPDLAIVVAFRMLPEIIWSYPRLGTFNLHASLLPDYRGAAPINWAIINGETKSGVTTFLLNHQIDCGAIIDQREVEITRNDSAGTLHDKLMYVGSRLVIDTVEIIATEKLTPRPQPSTESDPKAAPKIFKDDCQIEWGASTDSIYNKIRGLSPYPAAWCDFLDGTTAKLLAVSPEYDTVETQCSTAAGEYLTDRRKYLKIRCSDGWINILSLQVAGKKAMNIGDFLRGFRWPEA